MTQNRGAQGRSTLYMLMDASKRGGELSAISKHAARGSVITLPSCHTIWRGECNTLCLVFEAWQTHTMNQTDRHSRLVRYGTQHTAKNGKGTLLGTHTQTHTYSRNMSHSRLCSCNYVQTCSKSSALTPVSAVSNSYPPDVNLITAHTLRVRQFKFIILQSNAILLR